MDEFDLGFGDLSSASSFDLLSLGLLPGEEAFFPQEEADDGEPKISPYHDLESAEFMMWITEEAEKESLRRQAEKAAAQQEP